MDPPSFGHSSNRHRSPPKGQIGDTKMLILKGPQPCLRTIPWTEESCSPLQQAFRLHLRGLCRIPCLEVFSDSNIIAGHWLCIHHIPQILFPYCWLDSLYPLKAASAAGSPIPPTCFCLKTGRHEHFHRLTHSPSSYEHRNIRGFFSISHKGKKKWVPWSKLGLSHSGVNTFSWMTWPPYMVSRVTSIGRKPAYLTVLFWPKC